eukprot:GHVN01105933.1.p1 GENE.GHVN01105933.1~~GHVN01105933.1.p1  ORF type:complete len:1379 (-),score=288.77 GHVN01105933.1:128-4264(-)
MRRTKGPGTRRLSQRLSNAPSDSRRSNAHVEGESDAHHSPPQSIGKISDASADSRTEHRASPRESGLDTHGSGEDRHSLSSLPRRIPVRPPQRRRPSTATPIRAKPSPSPTRSVIDAPGLAIEGSTSLRSSRSTSSVARPSQSSHPRAARPSSSRLARSRKGNGTYPRPPHAETCDDNDVFLKPLSPGSSHLIAPLSPFTRGDASPALTSADRELNLTGSADVGPADPPAAYGLLSPQSLPKSRPSSPGFGFGKLSSSERPSVSESSASGVSGDVGGPYVERTIDPSFTFDHGASKMSEAPSEEFKQATRWAREGHVLSDTDAGGVDVAVDPNHAPQPLDSLQSYRLPESPHSPHSTDDEWQSAVLPGKVRSLGSIVSPPTASPAAEVVESWGSVMMRTVSNTSQKNLSEVDEDAVAIIDASLGSRFGYGESVHVSLEEEGELSDGSSDTRKTGELSFRSESMSDLMEDDQDEEDEGDEAEMGLDEERPKKLVSFSGSGTAVSKYGSSKPIETAVVRFGDQSHTSRRSSREGAAASHVSDDGSHLAESSDDAHDGELRLGLSDEEESEIASGVPSEESEDELMEIPASERGAASEDEQDEFRRYVADGRTVVGAEEPSHTHEVVKKVDPMIIAPEERIACRRLEIQRSAYVEAVRTQMGDIQNKVEQLKAQVREVTSDMGEVMRAEQETRARGVRALRGKVHQHIEVILHECFKATGKFSFIPMTATFDSPLIQQHLIDQVKDRLAFFDEFGLIPIQPLRTNVRPPEDMFYLRHPQLPGMGLDRLAMPDFDYADTSRRRHRDRGRSAERLTSSGPRRHSLVRDTQTGRRRSLSVSRSSAPSGGGPLMCCVTGTISPTASEEESNETRATSLPTDERQRGRPSSPYRQRPTSFAPPRYRQSHLRSLSPQQSPTVSLPRQRGLSPQQKRAVSPQHMPLQSPHLPPQSAQFMAPPSSLPSPASAYKFQAQTAPLSLQPPHSSQPPQLSHSCLLSWPCGVRPPTSSSPGVDEWLVGGASVGKQYRVALTPPPRPCPIQAATSPLLPTISPLTLSPLSPPLATVPIQRPPTSSPTCVKPHSIEAPIAATRFQASQPSHFPSMPPSVVQARGPVHQSPVAQSLLASLSQKHPLAPTFQPSPYPAHFQTASHGFMSRPIGVGAGLNSAMTETIRRLPPDASDRLKGDAQFTHPEQHVKFKETSPNGLPEGHSPFRHQRPAYSHRPSPSPVRRESPGAGPVFPKGGGGFSTGAGGQVMPTPHAGDLDTIIFGKIYMTQLAILPNDVYETWATAGPAIIKKLSAAIGCPPGRVEILCGPVGCGPSSVCEYWELIGTATAPHWVFKGRQMHPLDIDLSDVSNIPTSSKLKLSSASQDSPPGVAALLEN